MKRPPVWACAGALSAASDIKAAAATAKVSFFISTPVEWLEASSSLPCVNLV
jgi:hypothetical protein